MTIPVLDMCDEGLNTRITIFWIEAMIGRRGAQYKDPQEPLF